MWNIVSSVLSKSPSLPGLPGLSLDSHDPRLPSSTWRLYSASLRQSHDSSASSPSPVSVLVSDLAHHHNHHALLLARNYLRKLRSLRHPDILRFIDGSSSDSAVYIVVEPVLPLLLDNYSSSSSSSPSSSALVWGISHLATALTFIHETGNSIHANIHPSSIFTTPAGEWRLAGFDLLSSFTDDDPDSILFSPSSPSSSYPNIDSFYPSPELSNSARNSFSAKLKQSPISALDSYQLALLINHVFNRTNPSSYTSISQGKIPTSIFQGTRRLALPDPSKRLSCKAFYNAGFTTSSTTNPHSGFFANNRLVKLSKRLESFALAQQDERDSIVNEIKNSVVTRHNTDNTDNSDNSDNFNTFTTSPSLPPSFLTHKVLPLMIKALEFSPGGSNLLGLILSLGSSLTQQEFSSSILQHVLRLYSNSDRAIRLALLEHLHLYVDKLDNKVVTDKIWPNLLTGFTDVVPVIREATVRSIPLFAPKLSERILNNDLLRYLSKTQTDSEPGIRTNTCILLAKLSNKQYLSPTTSIKVLVPAFARSLRDPFLHARIAGITAYMATSDCYPRDDIAAKIIPAISLRLVDKEKPVRDQAFQALNVFLTKLTKLVAEMPETAQPNPLDPNKKSFSNTNPSTSSSSFSSSSSSSSVVESASSAAAALSGWAVTSLSQKLSLSDSNNNATSANSIQRSSSTPPHQTPPSISSSSSSNTTHKPISPSPLQKPLAASSFSSDRLPTIKNINNNTNNNTHPPPQRSSTLPPPQPFADLNRPSSSTPTSSSSPAAAATGWDLDDGDAGDWGTADSLIDFAVKDQLDDWAPMETSSTSTSTSKSSTNTGGPGYSMHPMKPSTATTNKANPAAAPLKLNSVTASLKEKQISQITADWNNHHSNNNYNSNNNDADKWKSLASAAPPIKPSTNNTNNNNNNNNNNNIPSMMTPLQPQKAVSPAINSKQDDSWGNFEDGANDDTAWDGFDDHADNNNKITSLSSSSPGLTGNASLSRAEQMARVKEERKMRVAQLREQKAQK